MTVGAMLVSVMLTGCASSSLENLNNTAWVLETLNNKPVPSEAPQITLNFNANGKITGTAGCNRYMSDYTFTLAENKIYITSIGRTFMQCNPTELMDMEKQYIQLLVEAEHYTIKDDQLELQNKDGLVTLVFTED